MRLLLAEDDPAIAMLIRDRFVFAGYEVTHVADGGSAWKAATAPGAAFDVAVIDVTLPVMSGIDVCRKLKATPATSAIPVVMMTAKGQDSDEQSSLEAGAAEHIAKPFDIAVLLETAGRLAARRPA